MKLHLSKTLALNRREVSLLRWSLMHRGVDRKLQRPDNTVCVLQKR